MEYLISIGRLDEAAVKLAEIVNDVSHIEDPPLCVQELVTPNIVCLHPCRISLSLKRASPNTSCGRSCVFSSPRILAR